MHNIQRKILNRLLYTKECRYSQLRPKGVESNHFAYHLEQLIKNDIIVKNNKTYTLSNRGLTRIDQLSQQKMTDREQPHIVTAIDLTNNEGLTLIFTRNFQPYINLSGWPMGKIHLEENVLQAAERELLEKTGLSGIELTQKGIVYIDAQKDGTRISKVLYHIFHGETDGQPETTTPDHRGSCQWMNHKSLDSQICMPGFLRVKQLLEKNSGFFFEELTHDIK